MANHERAEMEIELGGKKRKLVPTFQALCEIEDKAGEGIPSLLSRFGKGGIGFKAVAAILFGGMRAAGSELSFEEVGGLVQAEGLGKLALPCARFLAEAIAPAQKDGTKEGEKGKPGKKAEA